MKKHIVTCLVIGVLVLSLLTACGSKPSVISAEKAQQIALQDAGLSQKDVDDIHTHVATYEDAACYQIHITVGSTEYTYLISSTGQILQSGK